jgi:hypothetical protein
MSNKNRIELLLCWLLMNWLFIGRVSLVINNMIRWWHKSEDKWIIVDIYWLIYKVEYNIICVVYVFIKWVYNKFVWSK